MLNVPRFLARRLLPAVAATLGLLAAFPAAPRALAQAGSLDPNFNPGANAVNFAGSNSAAFAGQVFALDVQGASGQPLLGGNFANVGELRRNFQTRLNADDSPDTAYNNASVGFDNVVRAVLFQPASSQTIVGGTFTAFGGVSSPRIERINNDGTVDLNFTVGAGANNAVLALALGADANILVGGEFSTFSGANAGRIVRLFGADGTLDTTFLNNTGSGADGSVEAIAVQVDGRILLGGNFNSFNSIPRRGLVRLNADGTVDSTFNPGLGFNGRVTALRVQADGNIVVGGEFSAFNGNNRRGVVRLLPSGAVDPTFDPAGAGTNGSVRALLLVGGFIYVGGDFTTYDGLGRNRIVRLNPDGTLDGLFNPGAGANAPVRAFATAGGNLLIGGDFSSFNGATRLSYARADLNTGAVITNALPASGVGFRALEVNALAVTSNNKVLAGGNFTSLTGLARFGVDRLNTDGSPDTTFNTGLGEDFNVTRAIARQFTVPATGSGVTFVPGNSAGGDDFTVVGGDFVRRLARLNPNGSTDTTTAFDSPFSPAFPDATVRAIVTQSALSPFSSLRTNFLLVGGDFTQIGTRPVRGLARLFADTNAGAVDPAFNPDLGPGSSVRAIAVQPDSQTDDQIGPILIGGDFTRANGTARVFLSRLNSADGSTDSTFLFGTGPDAPVEALAVNPVDRKITVAGSFNTFSGQARRAVVRLNPDGSLDPAFSPNLPPGAVVRAVALQPDGRVVIGGDFPDVGGVARANLARLNVDGTLDTSFNSSANGTVRALALRGNGRIVVGGSFSAVNGTPRARIAQLNGDQQPGAFVFSDPAFNVSQTATTVTVTVLRQGGAAGTATVRFATVDGTARAGVDYVATSGTLTFPDGDTTPKTFTVTLLSPPNPADNRTFSVVLSSPTGDTTLGNPSTATVNITVAAPGDFAFASTATSVREDAGSAAFVVTRSNGSAGQVTLSFSTAEGTNARGRFTPVSGTITFGDGDVSPKIIRIPVINNAVRDGTATVILTLLPPTGSPVVAGGSATATLTILDDEALPATLPTTFQFATPVFNTFETETTAVITVTRAGGPAAPFSASTGIVTVDYFVSSRTGRLGVNFTNTFASPTSGTLVWTANDFTPKTFTVAVLRDGLATSDLQLDLTLANPQPLRNASGAIVVNTDGTQTIPASLGNPNQATLNVVDADSPAILQFTQAVFLTSEDRGAAVITVQRTGGLGTAVAVAYSTGGGTAEPGVRYAPSTGTVAWAAGDGAPKSIVIPLIQDNLLQPDQTAGIALGLTQGNAVLGPQGRTDLLISDDDGGQFFPVISVDSFPASVATTTGRTKGFFNITRRDRLGGLPDLSFPVTVGYAARGTAQNGQEYRFLNGLVTIPAGQQSVRIKVKAINGGGNRMSTVKLVLSGGEGYFVNPAASRAKVKIVFPNATTP